MDLTNYIEHVMTKDNFFVHHMLNVPELSI